MTNPNFKNLHSLKLVSGAKLREDNKNLAAIVGALLSRQPLGLRTDQVRSALAREGTHGSLADIARTLRELSETGEIRFENQKWRSLTSSFSPRSKNVEIEFPPKNIKSESIRPIVSQKIVSVQPEDSLIRPTHFTFKKEKLERQVDYGNGPSGEMPSGCELLRKLAPYYKDCLRAEERPNMLVGVEKSGDRFLALTSTGMWWPTLDEAVLISLKMSDLPDGFLKALSKRGDDETFIGYPVSLIPSKDGGALIQPVFTLACRIDAIAGEIKVTAPPQMPDINAGWFERFFKDRNEGVKFLRWLGIPDTSAEEDTELGVAEEYLEISDAATRFAAFVGKGKSAEIIPERLSKELKISSTKPAIENTAILFLASLTRFNKGSISELTVIPDWPDDDLLRTGLSAVLEDEKTHGPLNGCSVLSPIRLNEEQLNSVKAALESEITVITGPPGTGKSQAVAAIMASAALDGRSVLLASKNHKALDAIEERLNELTGSRSILVRVSRPWGTGRAFDLKVAINAILNRNAPQNKKEFHQNRTDSLKTVDRRRWGLYEKLREFDKLSGRLSANHELQGELGTRLSKQAIDWVKEVRRPIEFENPGRILERFLKIPLISDWVNRLNQRRIMRKIIELDIPWESIGLQIPGRKNLQLCLKHITDLERSRRINLASKELQNRLDRLPDFDDTLAQTIKLHDEITKSAQSLFGELPEVLDELTDQERRILLELRGSMSVLSSLDQSDSQNEQARKLWENSVAIVMKHMPLWAVTNLSASKIPFFPALFDYLIIDEASACDIPSAIPLFARCKQVVIVGDPAQLQHVTKLSITRERELLNKNEILKHGIGRFTHRENSVFSLASSPSKASRHLLREHYRCHAAIAEYFNTTFYGSRLRVMTDTERLLTPTGEKAGLHWTNVAGPITAARSGCYANQEIEASITYLKDLLVEKNFRGTVGVVTVFREQANRLMDRISAEIPAETIVRANLGAFTAHQFQGDARDVIVLSLCLGPDMPPGSLSFVAQTANLMNVAISRARAVCHVFGDLEFARNSGIHHLTALVESAEKASQSHPVSQRFESPWEERLFEALQGRGLNPIPQYPVAGRRLDLALVLGNLKIDIEIDGSAYHRNPDGTRKSDDLWRDYQIKALGWVVKRFWVYQLKENMEACVDDIVRAVAGYQTIIR